ncbi:N-formylglutamate amidohydrolase [Roseospira goensis]|uniref:N-formylglutamate amidohydrolase n=1 Tax=Roseospira goensis TaxID=391922 RepID=A0A7W6S2H4_9PROT|nr:N-formylglutamate amidohydrolase [Roseospira goensis]MBB4287557.1 N-formylglutamate amidohydrolase [Roseospira goensis]
MQTTDIPRVLALHRPEADAPQCPVVLDSPHSGTDYPDDFGTILSPALYRRAEDTHIGALYDHAPAQGAVLLEALFPRVYIDPNRSLDDLDPALLAEPWPTPLSPSVKTQNGQGLIWRTCPTWDAALDLYDRRLTVAEVRHRIETYFQPYHAALKAELDAAVERFGVVYHLDCHSMPSVSTPMSPEGPGVTRPDFTLGDRHGTTCDPAFTELVRATLAGLGYRVTVNDPYAGVELVRAYADPAQGRHALQVEISRALYMDEDSFAPNGGYAALKADLERLVTRVCAYVREQARAST